MRATGSRWPRGFGIRGVSLFFGVGIILIGAAILYVVVTSPQRDLNRFLNQIVKVEVGKTKLDDWRKEVERTRSSNLIVRCDQRTCSIGWRGENRLLKALRLAPQTVVDASVGFDDGVASGIHIVMEVAEHHEIVDWHRDKAVVVRLSNDSPAACHQHYNVQVAQRYGVGERNWATVAMDRCVSREDFATAVGINAGCLTRIGGCLRESYLELVDDAA
jgi:hypothetical protein